MKPTEPNTKMPTAITGFFAMLQGLLHIRGARAPFLPCTDNDSHTPRSRERCADRVEVA
jgi:hypothetical protein